MKKFDLILRMRGPPGLCAWSSARWWGHVGVDRGAIRRPSPSSGEEDIHLADRLREHLERAAALELPRVLARGEDEAQLHPSAAVLLGESHLNRGDRRLGIRRPVPVGESVGELE